MLITFQFSLVSNRSCRIQCEKSISNHINSHTKNNYAVAIKYTLYLFTLLVTFTNQSLQFLTPRFPFTVLLIQRWSTFGTFLIHQINGDLNIGNLIEKKVKHENFPHILLRYDVYSSWTQIST